MRKQVVSSSSEEDAEWSSGSEQPSIFSEEVIGEKFKKIKKQRRSDLKMVIQESSIDEETTEQYYLEERESGKKRKSKNEGPKKNKGNKKHKTAIKSVPEEDSEEEYDAELKIKVQQQKCALHSFHIFMNIYREKIPQRTWDLLAQTTFWDTIDVFKNEKLTERQVKKHELDFELIMKHYNKEKNKFIFGEIEAEITVNDVNSLFHISTEGEVVDLKNKPPRNKWPDSKYFEKGRISKDNIKRPQLETELSAELNKPEKNQDAEKIASLILMYLLAVFFFSRSGTHLDWELIIICENLEEINKYNWSKMVLDFLKDGIYKYRKDKAQIYSGCILLIVYWFLEKTRVRNRITGNETSTPRFVRWNIKEIFDRKDVQKKPTFLEVKFYI